MIFIDSITFPDKDKEFDFFLDQKLNCFTSFYPFQILSKIELSRLDFEPVTILCGSNGCGKTTALNVIAESLNIQRHSAFNKSSFFKTYTDMCKVRLERDITENSRIITSDDVFDNMLNIRSINDGVDRQRENLYKDYSSLKSSGFKMRSLEDYDELVRVNSARRKTKSKFVRDELSENIRERSNGESAYVYFIESITEDGVFLLDEPENSLSVQRQLELKSIIEDYAAYFNCQFIISTHSPFLLSIRNAKIYDFDTTPVELKKWTEIESVRIFYDFFSEHNDEFEI